LIAQGEVIFPWEVGPDVEGHHKQNPVGLLISSLYKVLLEGQTDYSEKNVIESYSKLSAFLLDGIYTVIFRKLPHF
jgi:hypothetical protein